MAALWFSLSSDLAISYFTVALRAWQEQMEGWVAAEQGATFCVLAD
jgi:hypothetical protein